MSALAFDPQVPTRADRRLDLVHFELLERPDVPDPVKRSLGGLHQSSVAEDGELVILRQYIAEGVGRSNVSAEDRLFLALSFYYPIRNARNVARKLLAHFGSIGSVLAASQYALGELVADAAGLWTYLTSLHTLALSALFEDASAEKVDLGNRGKLEKYLASCACPSNAGERSTSPAECHESLVAGRTACAGVRRERHHRSESDPCSVHTVPSNRPNHSSQSSKRRSNTLTRGHGFDAIAGPFRFRYTELNCTTTS